MAETNLAFEHDSDAEIQACKFGICMGGSRGGDMGSGPNPPPLTHPPLKNHKIIQFLCNTGPDPLKNHKAIKPAFNVGPASARPRNAISMVVFQWRFADGLMLAHL